MTKNCPSHKISKNNHCPLIIESPHKKLINSGSKDQEIVLLFI